MVAAVIDVSQTVLDKIADEIDERIKKNDLFIHNEEATDDFSDLEYNATLSTAFFKAELKLATDFYTTTQSGGSERNDLPRLSAEEAFSQQFLEAARLRTKWETPKSLEDIVRSGKRSSVIADKYVACRSYNCSSCTGHGSITCHPCNGNGYSQCTACMMSYNGRATCFACQGSGGFLDSQGQSKTPCSACLGTGKRYCSQCDGTQKIRCNNCGGSGENSCRACSSTGIVTDYYGVKYTSSLVYETISTTFDTDEASPVAVWMHNGCPDANERKEHAPTVVIRHLNSSNSTTEQSTHTLSVLVGVPKLTSTFECNGEPIVVRHLSFDKPWVRFNPYLDAAVAKIAEKADKLAHGTPSDFLKAFAKHPRFQEALRTKWDREDIDGSKWATEIHEESHGSISKESVQPIYMAFRHAMERHERKVVRKAYKLPILVILLLWCFTQYQGFPYPFHFYRQDLFMYLLLAFYILSPYFIASKMMKWSVKRRFKKETGADQKPNMGIAGRIVPVLSSALFAATWYFNFNVQGIEIGGRQLIGF